MQEVYIRPYEQMEYAQPRICPGKRDVRNSLWFWNTTGSPNLGQTTRLRECLQKKKRKKRKENLPNNGFAVPVERRKAKSEMNTWNLQENWKNYGTWKWRWYQLQLARSVSHQRIGTGTEGVRNKRMSGDHSNYSIVKIGQNILKSPGDLRIHGVTQNPVENHQLTLVWKTPKWVK